MQIAPVTCNEQKNKWSRTEYKKYLINHPVIQHVYVLGQEPLRVYEKQFPAQFEGTGIHHGGLGAGHGGSGLKPQMGSVGAGTGQWLHSPCEVGAGRWRVTHTPYTFSVDLKACCPKLHLSVSISSQYTVQRFSPWKLDLD